LLNAPDCLCQRVAATPNGNPYWPVVIFISQFNNQVASGRIVVFPDKFETPVFTAKHGLFSQVFRTGPVSDSLLIFIFLKSFLA
jgi:hypothetical protein